MFCLCELFVFVVFCFVVCCVGLFCVVLLCCGVCLSVSSFARSLFLFHVCLIVPCVCLFVIWRACLWLVLLCYVAVFCVVACL